MKKKKPESCLPVDLDQVIRDVQSPDSDVRARAVRSLCPCRNGWQIFENHLHLVDALRKDPDPIVRANALHVFEDAAE